MESTPGTEKRLRGEVVYLFAFDVAYDMTRRPINELMGRPVRDYIISPSKRMPRGVFFYRARTLELAVQNRIGPDGPVEVSRSVRIFSVGALAVQVRVPFAVDGIGDLLRYHELAFKTGKLAAEVRQLVEEVRSELAPWLIRPAELLEDPEAYTVFCIEGLGPIDAERWLEANRREVAGLLTEEVAGDLSAQEVRESTALYRSYYSNDMVVVDWDAALVVGARESLDDLLHIMELANVQLVELGAYDRLLDLALETSYRDLSRPRYAGRRDVRQRLREIKVDVARLSDELGHITKFFGDWHLADVYQHLSRRFHLEDWHRIIKEKLSTLGELYGILLQDRTNYWMIVLETSIVALFIFEVIMLFLLES